MLGTKPGALRKLGRLLSPCGAGSLPSQTVDTRLRRYRPKRTPCFPGGESVNSKMVWASYCCGRAPAPAPRVHTLSPGTARHSGEVHSK